MNILLIGKPGSGKGTLSQALKSSHNVFHMSSGDLLREEIAKETEIGKEIASYINGGNFAPESLVQRMVNNAIDGAHADIVLLDGYPRNVRQLDSFLNDHAIDAVVHLECNDDIIIQRITGRLLHVPSGRIYHEIFNPPKTTGIDDVTGEVLTRRPDDNIDALKKRLAIYHNETFPIIEAASQRGIPVLTCKIGDNIPEMIHEIYVTYMANISMSGSFL